MTIASGTVGTCPWNISDDGTLTIGAGNINIFVITASSWPWNSYCEQIVSVDFSGTVTFSAPLSSADTTCSCMFYYMRNLTSVTNLNRLNTAGVKNMFSMFYYCDSLTSIDVSTLNTSSATNMGMMFYNCSSLTSLDLSAWNTSNVTNMYGMFNGCSSLVSLDITGFNVSNVTDFGSFLNGCEALESIDVSGFTTSSAMYMQYMFRNCKSITSLDLSLFDTSNVTSIYWMFDGCDMLTSITLGSSFDLDSVDGSRYVYFVVHGKTAENVTNGIIITSDQGFFSLTTAERQGIWDRACDATFSASATRTSGGSVDEDGDDVTFNIVYVTESSSSTRTLNIYKKAASDPSYPSTAVYTSTLPGDSGTATPTLSNIGDGAYDFKVVFYDGDNYFIAYPSVQSNVRLVTIDSSGNVEVIGGITCGGDITGSGNIACSGNITSAGKKVVIAPDVLYPSSGTESSSGTNGTVTLSDAASNYNHMRIYYYGKSSASTAYKRYDSTDVYSPDGKYVSLAAVSPQTPTSTAVDISCKVVLISGSQITTARATAGNVQSSPGAGLYNEVYITRVEAWNE